MGVPVGAKTVLSPGCEGRLVFSELPAVPCDEPPEKIENCINPIALRKAKTVYKFGLCVYNFGFSECKKMLMLLYKTNISLQREQSEMRHLRYLIPENKSYSAT